MVGSMSSLWYVLSVASLGRCGEHAQIPGDGIGAEITDAVKEIFEHVNAPIEWEQYDVSGNSAAHEDLFKQAVESMKRNKVGLKGV